MKITRKFELHEKSTDTRIPIELEIELTEEELLAAYREQDRKFMEEDLEDAYPDSEWVSKKFEISSQEFESLKKKIVDYYEQIHNDEFWLEDMNYAVTHVIDEYKEGK